MVLHRPTAGFSLVELSIVLVILGLLVGGILGGQTLIRAAELRGIGTEMARYYTAVNAFRDKYMALPGDMDNATQFWGAADGGDGIGSDCTYTDSVGPTCNGSGNRTVGLSDIYAESHLFWEHLANAGVLDGSFTGAPDCASMSLSTDLQRCVSFGVNSPASKFPAGGWYAQTIGLVGSASTWMWPGDYGLSLFYGGINMRNGVNDLPETPILTPAEMWNIDLKNDDGKPGRGRILTYESRTDCHSTTSADTAEYRLDNDNPTCHFVAVGLD